MVNFKVDRFDFEFGVGYGLTSGSDRWMTKLMITTDLFDKPKEDDDKKPTPGKMKMVTKASKKAPASTTPAEASYNYAGCFAGGYFGGPKPNDLDAFDPRSTGGAVPAGTFYNAPVANAGNAGAYRVPFNATAMTGGTVGCNWHPAGSHFVWGAEGELGYMRLNGTAINPYSTDTVDRTVIGNWFGAVAGRAGYAMDRALFYADKNVMIVGAKPADDGDGVIVKVLDVAGQARSVGLWPAAYAFKLARRTNIVEQNGDPIAIGSDGRASVDIAAWGVGAARLSTPAEGS